MPEKEKDVVETIYKAVPLMSDFDKGYLYGKAETLLAQEETETEVQEKADGKDDKGGAA